MAVIKYCGKYQGPVNKGEERLLEFLKVNLPDNYYLLPGIEIPNLNPKNSQVQYLEYDCLVVTPHAIYNIENKDYAGRLEGDDNFWYHKDKEMRNPHKTVRFKTGVLAGKLRTINPNWHRAWIQSLVTLSHPTQNLSGIWGDHTNATFLLNEKLIKHITDPYSVGKIKDDIADIYEAIRDEICGTAQQRRPQQKREVEGYEVIEILDQEKNYTEYLAKPKGVTSAVRKRIKEYALDIPSLPEEHREKREKQIKNQYAALNKIKTNPFILNVQFKIDEENHRFFEITDYLDENSLRAELKRKTFTFKEKLDIIENVITALKAAHDVGIFHRDVSPENIFMTGGYACLGNFGKSFFADHQTEGYTVQATLTEQTATAYHAAELLQKDSYRASDIYSLGVLAYELFVGKQPFASPFELIKLGGRLPQNLLPSAINPALPKWLDELCNHCIRTVPEDRWDNLNEMQEFLNKQTVFEPIKEESKTPITESAEQAFEIGSRILDYTIYSKLGSGGYSQVYKVKHSLRSNTNYALKVFHESVHASSVMDEYEALKDINHPNIVKFAWNGTLPSGQFYTLMEFLDGENLKEYAKGEKRLPLYRVYQVAKDILNALVTLQSKNPPLFHRDIKPQNIVFDQEERFVLIDFNVASALESNKEHVGTHPYLAPDLIADNYKVNWNKSADTFALGITLYELACKIYPWNGSIKMPQLDRAPVYPTEIHPNIAKSFADFLFKAIQPREEDRFKDANEMFAALQLVGETNIVAREMTAGEPKAEEIQDVHFVAYINSLFSQSKHGNTGTRAGAKTNPLDDLTYTPTKLDTRLIPDVLDGKYRLVIITGNAGDGKTAFIRKIEQKASNRVPLANRNGARFKIGAIDYVSNYDGSQDEDERANDTVLSEFFRPFENVSSYNKASQGRIIAINEGRLVEFLKTSGKFEQLATIIEEYFYKGGKVNLPDGLLIVNLNLRSIVASDKEEGSLFKKQIQKLTDKRLWSKCKLCSLADKCFIKYNVETLSDTAAGNEITNRIEWLLRTVALKRELHITMRDLRSFISFLLTRDYNCKDIPVLYESLKENPLEWWKLHYFNITDSSTEDDGNQDRLIKLLRETDIALVSAPTLDRDLFFGEHKSKNFLEFGERKFALLDQFNSEKIFTPSYEQSEEMQLYVLEMHKVFRRHQFFEGKINFYQRLPYRSIGTFYEKLTSDKKSETQAELLNSTLLNVSKAISLNEGCDKPEIYSKYLVLSSSHVNDPYSKSFRLFPLSDFELIINKASHLVNYLEYEPDSLTFRSKTDSKISLSISLDLYEMLDFIGKGYSPSLNDLRGRFIELQIFKNLLENKSYTKVVVTRDNREFFMIQLNDQKKLQINPLNLMELEYEN